MKIKSITNISQHIKPLVEQSMIHGNGEKWDEDDDNLNISNPWWESWC